MLLTRLLKTIQKFVVAGKPDFRKKLIKGRRQHTRGCYGFIEKWLYEAAFWTKINWLKNKMSVVNFIRKNQSWE